MPENQIHLSRVLLLNIVILSFLNLGHISMHDPVSPDSSSLSKWFQNGIFILIILSWDLYGKREGEVLVAGRVVEIKGSQVNRDN